MKRTKLMNKTWKVILAVLGIMAAAALAAAVVLGIKADKRAEAKEYSHSIAHFYADEEGASRFTVDDKLLEDRIGSSVDNMLTCDGTTAIARAGTALYRIDAEGILKIYPAGVEWALLSLDNNVIVFTTATQAHVYDHRTGELEDIKPDGAVSIPSIAVSPDGKTVAYSVKTSDGNMSAYVYDRPGSTRLAENAYIIGIADGGKRFYYVEPDTASLHFVAGSRDRKLGEDIAGAVEFNRDLSEVIFDMNGSTYSSVNGSPAKKLVDGRSIFPTTFECRSIQGGAKVEADVNDTSSLFGGVYYGTRASSSDDRDDLVYDLWYVDGLRRVKELVKGASQFSLIENRTRIACLVDRSVYELKADDPSDRDVVCNNTHSFCVTPDGKSFYCVGFDLGLYYVEKNTQPVLLSRNAVHAQLTSDGKCLFLTDYSKTGVLKLAHRTEPVVNLASSVAHIETKPNVSFYMSNVYNDSHGSIVYDVWFAGSDMNFEPLLKGVLANTDNED